MEKPMISNVLKTFTSFRPAFAVAAGISLLLAMSVSAQQPAPSPATGGDVATAGAVVVTGSNIPTAEEVTPSNVDTLTDADVQRSGQAGDVLQIVTKRDPNFTGAGNIGTTNANISSGGTQGGAVIQIRGLPTLVLFDGRRLADSAAIATGGAQFTDVTLFPTALIGRIEVLKDGASALYGSDAVGGVVNIFLKQDFTGFELGYRYGFSVEPGVAERRAYVIAGVGTDTTHVTAAFQYYEIDPLYQRERFYSRRPGGVTNTYAGSERDARSRYLFAPGVNDPFALGVIPGSVNGNAGGGYGSPLLNGAFVPASTAQVTAFDLSKLPTSTLKVRNTDEYASFTHDICGKQLEAFGDLLFAKNSNFSQLHGQPLSNATGVVIPAGQVGNGLPPSDPNFIPTIFNPFNTPIDSTTLSGAGRLIAANRYQSHPRTFDNDSTFYRVLGGLRSQINPDWFVEGAAYYSHYTIDFVNGGLVNAPVLNDLIANHQFDFFAANPVGVGGITGADFNSIFGFDIRKQDSYQKVVDFKVVGFPFQLPGGALGVSVGAEYRNEGFKVIDSPEIFVGSVPIENIDLGRAVSSFYGEIRVPIVGSQQNIPWVYSFEVSAAGRHDHYETVLKDANVPKLTARYQPFKDLTLRATYSNSFVAPTLYQLRGPPISGFSDTITFAGQGVQDQAQVLATSNPNLVPSTAETWTAGLVWSPSFVPGLTLTFDYFRALQQGIVGTLGGQVILDSVNRLGTASPYVAQVAFNNFPGQPGALPVTGPFQLQNNLQSVFYLDPLLNLGAYRVEGFDMSLHYILDLHNWGQLELGVASVVYNHQDAKRTSSSNYFNVGDQIGSEFTGATPDYRVTFLAEYRIWGFTLSLNANYIPSLRDVVGVDPETADQHNLFLVEDYFIADGRLSYEFHRAPAAPPTAPMGKDAKDGKAVVAGAPTGPCGGTWVGWGDRMLDGLRLTVGCNNLLDEDPRFVPGANSATNLATYDPYGRFVYFEVSHKF